MQFLNCVEELEESAENTMQLLGSMKGDGGGGSYSPPDGETDTDADTNAEKNTDILNSLNTTVMSPTGVFVQVDRLAQAVGELEYEVSTSCINPTCSLLYIAIEYSLMFP